MASKQTRKQISKMLKAGDIVEMNIADMDFPASLIDGRETRFTSIEIGFRGFYTKGDVKKLIKLLRKDSEKYAKQ